MQVVRTVVINGHQLEFVRTDDDPKVSMQSLDPVVQEWLNTIKHKRVKEKDIHFVVKAFTAAMNSANPTNYATSQKKVQPSQENVVLLNEWCQKRFGVSPRWEVSVDTTIPTDIQVDARVYLPNGTFYDGHGNSKKEAKADAAADAMADVDGGEFNY